MTDYFPHAALTPRANQRPSSQDLATLSWELTSTKMFVASIFGDGLSSNYALVATAAVYLAVSGVDFEAPAKPRKHICPCSLCNLPTNHGRHSLYATSKAVLKRILLAVVAPTITDKKNHTYNMGMPRS
jgi:hypothetical protein